MATYYVRSSGGNDSNAGTSFALGWATLQKAADTAVAGDLVLVCAYGNHLPTAKVDFDTNAGSDVAQIEFRGAGATGADDGTVATISGASLPATTDMIDLTVSVNHILFKGLRFTAATRDNVVMGSDAMGTMFVNCRMDNATGRGAYTTGSGSYYAFIGCEFDNNGGWGLTMNSGARGKMKVAFCSIHDNAGGGLRDSLYLVNNGVPYYDRNLIYDNAGVGLELTHVTMSSLGRAVITNNTIWNNSSDGVKFTSGDNNLFPYFANNILVDNGGYGWNISGTSEAGRIADIKNLCSYNNTSGHCDFNSGVLPGSGHVLESPQFVSTTDGAEDLTPQNTNLLIERVYGSGGTSHEYIGAIQPERVAGVTLGPYESGAWR